MGGELVLKKEKKKSEEPVELPLPRGVEPHRQRDALLQVLVGKEMSANAAFQREDSVHVIGACFLCTEERKEKKTPDIRISRFRLPTHTRTRILSPLHDLLSPFLRHVPIIVLSVSSQHSLHLRSV